VPYDVQLVNFEELTRTAFRTGGNKGKK